MCHTLKRRPRGGRPSNSARRVRVRKDLSRSHFSGLLVGFLFNSTPLSKERGRTLIGSEVGNSVPWDLREVGCGWFSLRQAKRVGSTWRLADAWQGSVADAGFNPVGLVRCLSVSPVAHPSLEWHSGICLSEGCTAAGLPKFRSKFGAALGCTRRI